MNALLHDIAHLGDVELRTPEQERSLWFFTEILGMTAAAQAGDSIHLRTYEDYEHHSLTLTAHRTSGIGSTGLRASSQEALERRVRAIKDAGLGIGWRHGAPGRGPTYAFRDPDGHELRLYWESQWYEPPGELRPALKNQPQAFPGHGVGVRRLDHVNFLAAEAAAADLCLDSGVFIETGPHRHAIQQTFFLYVYEPGGNRVELCNPLTRLILAPDWRTITWTEAERAKGQAWGLKTIASFHTHGTPPIALGCCSAVHDQPGGDGGDGAGAVADDVRPAAREGDRVALGQGHHLRLEFDGQLPLRDRAHLVPLVLEELPVSRGDGVRRVGGLEELHVGRRPR
ncbi:catechol 2,3-dioxygenase [Nonomuraea jabiensis]|uniref:Catechol 2,3-dioxygenase n=1 Tax=Nonomuraea jabiensis TaxID=882448 RepID=A0A7W9LCI3_9ACTN|nr:catechol 2,3-dioxygenase [Nonomuraea jabiensis]